MATPELITAPTSEPVSLAEARLHLRIDDDNTAYDTRLQEMVAAARQQAEHEMGRKILRQTWDFVLDAFPSGCESIKLPADLIKPHSIGHVKYLDTLGVIQTIDAADYDLDRHNLPGWLFPTAAAGSWPADVADSANAISIRVLCGEWENAADVPAAIKSWIKLHIGAQWRYEGALTPEQVSELPNRFAERLLDPWRVYAA